MTNKTIFKYFCIFIYSVCNFKTTVSQNDIASFTALAEQILIPLAPCSISFPVDNWLTYRTLLHSKMYFACVFSFQFFLFIFKLLGWFLDWLVESWIISVKLLLQIIHPWLCCIFKISGSKCVYWIVKSTGFVYSDNHHNFFVLFCLISRNLLLHSMYLNHSLSLRMGIFYDWVYCGHFS